MWMKPTRETDGTEHRCEASRTELAWRNRVLRLFPFTSIARTWKIVHSTQNSILNRMVTFLFAGNTPEKYNLDFFSDSQAKRKFRQSFSGVLPANKKVTIRFRIEFCVEWTIFHVQAILVKGNNRKTLFRQASSVRLASHRCTELLSNYSQSEKERKAMWHNKDDRSVKRRGIEPWLSVVPPTFGLNY